MRFNRYFSSYTKSPVWLFLSGNILGGFAANYYYRKHHSLSLEKMAQDMHKLSAENEEKIIELHKRANLTASIRHTLASRLIAPELTMYGKFIKDNSKESKEGKARLGFFATVYPWAPSGAVGMIVNKNTEDELFVLMVVDRRKQISGKNLILNFPQGYSNHGIPGNLGSMSLCKNMDDIEEAIVKNKGGIKPYKEQYSPRNIVPEGIPYETDEHHPHTVIREGREETGENLSSENIQSMRHLGYSQTRLSNGVNVFVDYYLTMIRDKTDSPIPPDTNEIMSVHWINLEKLQIEAASNQGFVWVNNQRYDIAPKDFMVMLQGLKAYHYFNPTYRLPLHLETAIRTAGSSKQSGLKFVFLDTPYPNVEEYIRPKLS